MLLRNMNFCAFTQTCCNSRAVLDIKRIPKPNVRSCDMYQNKLRTALGALVGDKGSFIQSIMCLHPTLGWEFYSHHWHQSIGSVILITDLNQKVTGYEIYMVL